MNQLYEAVANAIYDELRKSHTDVSIRLTETNNWVITNQLAHAVGVNIAVIGNLENQYVGKAIIYEQGTADCTVLDLANPTFTASAVVDEAIAFADTLRKRYLSNERSV